MHERSGLWNPSNSTEISLNHLWCVMTLSGWANGMLGPQSRLEGRGEEPSVRASGKKANAPMTIDKELSCTRLSSCWPQWPGFILVDLLAKHEAGSFTFGGFCLGWNRTPIRAVASDRGTLARATKFIRGAAQTGFKPGHLFQQRTKVQNEHDIRYPEHQKHLEGSGLLLTVP